MIWLEIHNFDLKIRFLDLQNTYISIFRHVGGLEGPFFLWFMISLIRAPSCGQNTKIALTRKPLVRLRSSFDCVLSDHCTITYVKTEEIWEPMVKIFKISGELKWFYPCPKSEILKSGWYPPPLIRWTQGG